MRGWRQVWLKGINRKLKANSLPLFHIPIDDVHGTSLYTLGSPGSLSDYIDKPMNQQVDMYLAAIGTFFAGVPSDDEMSVDVHREACWLLCIGVIAFVG
ncbi:hypothetical protein [Novosphingobium sp. CECT 9465]|uniref:hypothetical protein n=1 Tax=Novosphingobium sp. CECT 9465 TaxID=2829794 RepID=UPI001E5E6D0A|nr:hypothetical protein [Novosphingobium sp. CECT 9465]CAH0495695.1 hypothetical protein NVSP9465_00703 [Novosphingobium sp. CECT 9465]